MSKNNELELLRHYLATLAYRTQKAVSNPPDNFANLQIGKGVRTPIEILNHMSGLLLLVKAYLLSEKFEKPQILNWDEEINRFHNMLKEIDDLLTHSSKQDLKELKKLLQGPLSDAMTHIGELATLRRLAGSPIKGANYMKAKIEIGNVSKEQSLINEACD